MFYIKLAYYRQKDWDRFLKIIDDPESMHDTWNEWHKELLLVNNSLKKKGFETEFIEVNLEELTNYCKRRGIKNNGKARSQFVQAK